MSAKMVKVFGRYRNVPIDGLIFPLVHDIKEGKLGLFITVDGTGVAGFPENKFRIKINSKDDVAFVGSDAVPGSKESTPIVVESDAAIIKRIRERFEILNEMTEAAADGVVRGMIVSGPPGIGKSYGVEATLEKNNVMNKIAHRMDNYEIARGAISPIGLYMLLWENKGKGTVLVLDDCDSVLWEEQALNMLKAALDSGKKRRISWHTESRVLKKEGIPKTFLFEGSVIFISNVKFDVHLGSNRYGKTKDHLEAILSRCHYLDLTLDTIRDKMLRIKQIVGDGMLKSYNLSANEEDMLVKFVDKNKDNLREISLRMVLKIADLYKMSPKKNHWKRLAETTCMKRK